MSKVSFMSWDAVNLRPVEEEDLEFLQKIVQHPDVRNHIGRAPTPANMEEEKEWFEKINSSDNEVHFLIEYKGERAGECGLMGINKE